MTPGDPDGVPGGGPGAGARSRLFLAIAGTIAILLFLAFVALGTWQLKRRVWKLDLIARVEQRVHAPPAAAPGPAQWSKVSAATDEYRHVVVTGTFLNDSQTPVQAVTQFGAGYWVLTPLRTVDGTIVLINRGFVPVDDHAHVAPAIGQATVTGLLRMTEPSGGFLRHNDPAGNHWYSRDVEAIAKARGLTRVAPYFIDADADAGAVGRNSAGVLPIAGLTVITFHNSHLVYAITWYTLAVMVAAAIWLGIRNETRA